MLGHIEKLAGEMGATEPAVLAHQLGLLMDGAIVAAMVTRDPGVADTAGLTAGPLLVPSKSKKPKRAVAAEQLAKELDLNNIERQKIERRDLEDV